jgi:hypothetical protein
MTPKNTLETYHPVSNGAEPSIIHELPYRVEFVLEGVCPLLFHAWNNEAVEEKSKAKKGSAAKKSDNIESYVYRNEQNEICLPSEYVRQAIIKAARFRQDPRSPRKSAMDLFKAGIASEIELASLGSTEWDYVDKRRVVVQRNAVTRMRPAFQKGWTATFQFLILLPEYIDAAMLLETLTQAGRVIGVGDFIPSFGRFQVVRFDVLKA